MNTQSFCHKRITVNSCNVTTLVYICGNAMIYRVASRGPRVEDGRVALGFIDFLLFEPFPSFRKPQAIPSRLEHPLVGSKWWGLVSMHAKMPRVCVLPVTSQIMFVMLYRWWHASSGRVKKLVTVDGSSWSLFDPGMMVPLRDLSPFLSVFLTICLTIVCSDQLMSLISLTPLRDCQLSLALLGSCKSS